MEKPDRLATVGQLRTALAGIADDTPLTVNAAYPGEPEIILEQVITSTGFGLVDWGDGHGLGPGTVLALNCDVGMLDEPVRRTLGRHAAGRQAQAGPPTAGPGADGVTEPSAHDAAGCRTCGAPGDLEPVTSHSLADGAERTEWFCVGPAAYNDRRFPGLAELLVSGRPAIAPAEAEAES